MALQRLWCDNATLIPAFVLIIIRRKNNNNNNNNNKGTIKFCAVDRHFPELSIADLYWFYLVWLFLFFPDTLEAFGDFGDTFVSLVGDLYQCGLLELLFIVRFSLVGVAHRLTGHSAWQVRCADSWSFTLLICLRVRIGLFRSWLINLMAHVALVLLLGSWIFVMPQSTDISLCLAMTRALDPISRTGFMQWRI